MVSANIPAKNNDAKKEKTMEFLLNRDINRMFTVIYTVTMHWVAIKISHFEPLFLFPRVKILKKAIDRLKMLKTFYFFEMM